MTIINVARNPIPENYALLICFISYQALHKIHKIICFEVKTDRKENHLGEGKTVIFYMQKQQIRIKMLVVPSLSFPVVQSNFYKGLLTKYITEEKMMNPIQVLQMSDNLKNINTQRQK